MWRSQTKFWGTKIRPFVEKVKMSRNNWVFCFSILASCCLGLLLISRDFNVFLHPTFFAEECSVFFNKAYSDGPLAELFFFYDRASCYLLLINVGVFLAAFFPLEVAPYVTSLYALAFYLLGFFIILNNRNILTRSFLGKFLFCFWFLICCYSWQKDGFLTTAILYPAGATCALALLLIDYVPWKRLRLWPSLLLGFCGMATPLACFMAPSYVVKAIRTRNLHDMANTVVIIVCTGVQGLFMLSSDEKEYMNHFRGQIDSDVAGKILDVVFLQTFFDVSAKDTISDLPVIIPWILLLGLFAIWVAFILKGRSRFGSLLLLSAWICEAAGVVYGAAGDGLTGRYVAVLRFILFVLLLANLDMAAIWSGLTYLRHSRRFKILCTGTVHLAILLVLLTGSFVGLKKHYVPYSERLASVPFWKDEVRRFKEYDNYLITVYPAPQWKCRLGEMKVRTKPLIIGQEATIDDIMPYMDYYQLDQVKPTKSDRRYVTQTTLRVQFNIKEEGEYQLDALTQAIDGKHDSWILRTEWGEDGRSMQGRRKMIWPMPLSKDWIWTPAPETWRLEPDQYAFLMEPREPTPLAAVRIRRID